MLLIFSISWTSSNVILDTPLSRANSMCDFILHGLAKMIFWGSTPRLKTKENYFTLRHIIFIEFQQPGEGENSYLEKSSKLIIVFVNVTLFYLSPACTVKSCSKSCQSLEERSVIVALDCIEWNNSGTQSDPVLVLINHSAQVWEKECWILGSNIFIIYTVSTPSGILGLPWSVSMKLEIQILNINLST